MSTKYGSSSRFFNDVIFSPEMDDTVALDDRLEQARLNRTNYYRRMLANRSRPLDDCIVSRKTTYTSSNGNSNSLAKEPSISNTTGIGEIPKVPEPHSSWRFYTSYDNGEWKRHAVPVDHDEEEILREPTPSLRREREKVSPPIESSSIRRMRQAGGPLLACLQPRPKRVSESSTDSRNVVSGQLVNGYPVNGIDAGQLGAGTIVNIYGDNGEVVRYLFEGGELIPLDGEEPQPQGGGKVKQEYSSKYVSTVTVTQPKERRKILGSDEHGGGGGGGSGGRGGGGATTPDSGKAETEGSGVRKSRRPRIYGFQEKIIIPTKYKTATQDNTEESSVGVGQTIASASQVIQPVRKENIRSTAASTSAAVADGSEIGIIKAGVDQRKETVAELSRRSPGRTRLSPESQTVKVVVVNSGSDGEGGDRKSDEKKEEKKETETGKETETETGKSEKSESGFSMAPFVMKEGLSPMDNFKAFQETVRKQFESAGLGNSNVVAVEQDKDAANPNQRLFSKDEQSFSEVGPDGSKHDGKVLRTYEVITSGNDEEEREEGSVTHDRHPSVKEIAIMPVDAIHSMSRAIGFSPLMDLMKPIEIMSVMPTSSKIAGDGNIIRTVETRSTSLSPRTEEKKGVNAVEQTGSLFKQLSPRPRAERSKDSTLTTRETTRQWPSDRVSPLGNVTTTRTTRTWTRHNGTTEDQPKRKVTIVREDGTELRPSNSSSKTVETVDGTGAASKINTPHVTAKTVDVVREMDMTVAQNNPSETVKSVELVKETCSAPEQQCSTIQRTVEISTEKDARNSSSSGEKVFSIWDEPCSTSANSYEKSQRSSGGDIVDSTGPTRVLKATVTHTNTAQPADLSDAQWEVQVAVRD